MHLSRQRLVISWKKWCLPCPCVTKTAHLTHLLLLLVPLINSDDDAWLKAMQSGGKYDSVAMICGPGRMVGGGKAEVFHFSKYQGGSAHF